MIFRSWCWYLGFCFLAACKIGPDYARLEEKLPDKWVNILKTQGENDQTVAWWSHFNDPILTDLIETVAAQNLDLKSAEALILQNQALLDENIANLFPQFNVSTSVTTNQSSKNYKMFGLHRRYDAYSNTLGMNWEIDLFGQLRRAKEAAFAELGVQIENCYGVFLSLVSNVAETYIQLRGAQQKLMIAQQLAQKYKELYTLQMTLQQAGITNQINVENAKGLWERYEAMLHPLEAAIKTYMHSLSLLTAKEPTALYDLLAPLKDIPTMQPTMFLGLPSQLLERRPDIRKAEMSLMRATAQIGVAKGGLFPSFSLTGIVGYQSSMPSNFTSPGNIVYSAGPGLNWNIFDFGRVRSEIKSSEAFKDQAQLAYRQIILKALSEVEGALVSYAEETKRLHNLTKAKESQNKSADLVRDRFNAGLEPFSTSLEADISVLNNILNLLDSQTNVALDTVNIYKALGGGWESYAKETVKN